MKSPKFAVGGWRNQGGGSDPIDDLRGGEGGGGCGEGGCDSGQRRGGKVCGGIGPKGFLGGGPWDRNKRIIGQDCDGVVERSGVEGRLGDRGFRVRTREKKEKKALPAIRGPVKFRTRRLGPGGVSYENRRSGDEHIGNKPYWGGKPMDPEARET